MAVDKAVRIAGLRSLGKDLKAAERFEDLAEIGVAFGRVAEMVRVTAAARAMASGRRVDEKLAGSYKIVRSKVKAAIRIGDKSMPYVLGQEWGAHRNRPRRVNGPGLRTEIVGWRQFPEVRRGGRFIYPAADDHASAITELLADALERVLNANAGSKE